MQRSMRLTSWLVVAAVLIGVYAVADDQGPAVSELSPAVELTPEEQGIRRALEGDFSDAPPAGIYGDVLEIIKKQGSILDDTAFDPRADEDAVGQKVTSESQRAHAAEQLLKASRLLERLDSGDSSRCELVNRMRAQAVELLSE